MRTFVRILAAFLTGLTLVLVGIWIRSYFAVDRFEHIYPKHPGAAGHWAIVEGDRWWISPVTTATEIDLFGGRIVVSYPFIDGAPLGWRYHAEPYETVASGMKGPLPVNWLGFCARPELRIIPIWPILYLAGVVPALTGWRAYRRRRGRGFELLSKSK
jgi:hypothetical protein